MSICGLGGWLGEIRLDHMRGHYCEAEWLGRMPWRNSLATIARQNGLAEQLGNYCEAGLGEIRFAEQHHITEIITATQHRCFSFT